MFRIGKFNIHKVTGNTFTRRLSLARRLFFDNQTPSFGNSPREHAASSATAQGSSAGKQHKKSHDSESNQNDDSVSHIHWPRKIFSGIQPTGSLHLGNYLGAVRKWTDLQKSRDSIILCIVDMHSITLPHSPPMLRENIFKMAATLLACGVDPAQSTLFVQSAVLEHTELNWILSSLSTMPRLAQLPQFKDKSKTVRDVPLGLYVYPVLQAADIMLYKTTHVPVGADQLQHIQLAQHLTRNFNNKYGEMFPVCTPMIEQNDGSRILSLRDTTKKMSKSDPNAKSTINLSDTPEQIKEKIKKAITDFTSDISYSPNTRPGVSNLINIHALVTGQTIVKVVEEANRLDTAKYKEIVADAVIEHLRPIREKIESHLRNRNELIYMLEMGAEKARQIAQQTMSEVKQRLGLGTNLEMPASVQVAPLLPEHSRMTASQRLAKSVLHPTANLYAQPHAEQQRFDMRYGIPPASSGEQLTGDLGNADPVYSRNVRCPLVPVQTMRVEKSRTIGPPQHVFKMDTFNVPNLGFRLPSDGRSDHRERRGMPVARGNLGFNKMTALSTVNSISGFKYGQKSNPSAVAAVTSQVNAASKHQQKVSSVVNSAFYKAAVSSFNNIDPSVINVAVGSSQSRINNKAGTGSSSSSNTIDLPAAPVAEGEVRQDDAIEEEDESNSVKELPGTSKVEL